MWREDENKKSNINKKEAHEGDPRSLKLPRSILLLKLAKICKFSRNFQRTFQELSRNDLSIVTVLVVTVSWLMLGSKN
jgi:hypothetical protein